MKIDPPSTPHPTNPALLLLLVLLSLSFPKTQALFTSSNSHSRRRGRRRRRATIPEPQRERDASSRLHHIQLTSPHTNSPRSSSSSSSPSPMFSAPFVLSFTLLLSLPLLFLLAPHFLPPNNQIPIPAADEIDDQALFARAVRSKSAFTRLSLDSKTKPKIAFLFLTNSDLHFAPLWQRFFSKSTATFYNIYVHADPSINVTIPPGVFRDRFIASKRTYRASPTLISATRRLLATAVLDDPANAFFAVVSQYCVPLHSFRYVYHSLFASPTFDKSESDTELTRMGVKVRYRSFIEILSKSSSLWKRYAARGRHAMMPEVPFDRFRVGSQFFMLTRRHALVVLKDRRLWKKFRLPCYREDECYPEEHYFPTLLSIADPDGCTRYTLTRVNWTGTVNGHPHTYRPGEVSAQLIYRLRQSNFSESYLFARKFSPDCLQPLLGLSEKVIFRD